MDNATIISALYRSFIKAPRVCLFLEIEFVVSDGVFMSLMEWLALEGANLEYDYPECSYNKGRKSNSTYHVPKIPSCNMRQMNGTGRTIRNLENLILC